MQMHSYSDRQYAIEDPQHGAMRSLNCEAVGMENALLFQRIQNVNRFRKLIRSSGFEGVCTLSYMSRRLARLGATQCQYWVVSNVSVAFHKSPKITRCDEGVEQWNGSEIYLGKIRRAYFSFRGGRMQRI
jgi:hypothetical protein